MSELRQHFVRSLIDWLFRRRSPALLIMRSGLGLLFLSAAGWAVDLIIPGQIFARIDGGNAPTFVTYILLCIGSILTLVGMSWELFRWSDERKEKQRKKVVVIEVRGLRDVAGEPLQNVVPSTIKGRREPMVVDLRQRVKDGMIVDPNRAVEDLCILPAELRRRYDGFDRQDISLLYGGMAPVPLTFLTGVLLDDESQIVVFDWDRHASCWRSLEKPDDGKRFQVEGIDSMPVNVQEVILAVSVSYRVDVERVKEQFRNMPMVHLMLEGCAIDQHWSEEKQRELGRQFLDTVSRLANNGVTCIHLFMAAPNSVVFRFGRLYDKRNLPKILVYQYERMGAIAYPWAVDMPVGGKERPTVVILGRNDTVLRMGG